MRFLASLVLAAFTLSQRGPLLPAGAMAPAFTVADDRGGLARGVAWLLVNSSAAGTHSHLTPEDSRAYFRSINAVPTAALLDTNGKVGKLYGVATALHMVIVDPAGRVIYNGAIDDRPKTEAASLNGAHNYVAAALTEAFAGKPITTAVTVPYGCDVHYATGE